MALIANKKIAIVGAGPAGLTLGRLLQLKGAKIVIYERDQSRDVRVQGATLDLHEDSGLAAIRAAGLLDAFKANYRPGADKTRITDKNGNIVHDEHTDEKPDQDFGDEHFRPEIDRGPLRDILLDSITPDTIVWNTHIVSLSPEGDGWLLHFNNGGSEYADIVIGADGANSKVRSLVTDIKPIYSGFTVIEGNTYDGVVNAPRVNDLIKGGKLFAFGDEKSLIVSSKGDGCISFYAGFKKPETWTKNSGLDMTNYQQLLDWFKQEYDGWDNIWQELFNDKSYFVFRPQYSMPSDQTWSSRKNITVIGDAAHLMLPYAGEGVNVAMADALELSEALTGNHPTVQDSIAAYESSMFKRSSEIIRMSLHQAEVLHRPNAIEQMLSIMSGGNNEDE